MSTMPINQLPTPIQLPSMSAANAAVVPVPPVVGAPTIPPPPSAPAASSAAHFSPARTSVTGRTSKIAGLAAAVLLVAGVAVAVSSIGGGKGGGGNGGGNAVDGGSAGNASISPQEIAGAYGSEFGVAPSDATVACIAAELSSDVAPSVRALMDGRALAFDDTRAAILPFTVCAPDEDFLVNMVTASLVLVPGADEACVSDVVADSDAGARADALALSMVDPNQFADRLYNTVVGCA